ncbi:hypothetical protein BDZ91DRAFT_770516 [Kalaharituber pfeilii]|nr:hypothetical protein BDZ91DRAFT_770516 [Kalaharituber pfeilii]
MGPTDSFDDILLEFDNRYWDIADLIKSWIADRGAPEILPVQGPLVERAMGRIQEQIEIVERETVDLEPQANLRLIVIQTKLERVKIHYISSLTPLHSNLSPSKQSYLKSHLALLNSHYLASFLRNFPVQLRWLDETASSISMIEEPDLDSAVFCAVVKNVDGEDGGRRFTLRKGDLYIVRYSAMRKFLLEGAMELIWTGDLGRVVVGW